MRNLSPTSHTAVTRPCLINIVVVLWRNSSGSVADSKMVFKSLQFLSLLTLAVAIPRPAEHYDGMKKKGHAHTVPTYFRRQDENGNLISRNSPAYGKEITLPIVEEIAKDDRLNAALKVKPFIVENGEIVTVSWRGVTRPNAKDWIALLCPYGDKVDRQLDHFFADESPTWHKGYGSHKVHVFNMREDCELRYFRNDGLSSKLVARSNKLGFELGGDAPLQGRLALTGKPTEMRVMWTAAKCKFNHAYVLTKNWRC